MKNLLQDLRYGVRTLRRSPGFALVAILTLALGIGASSALFTVVNSVLLRPLPFARPERLVMVWEHSPNSAENNVASPANFAEWQKQSRSFEALGSMFDESLNLTGAGDPEEVRGQLTTANVFHVLGVRAALGRTYQPGEDAANVAVISHALWARRYGSDPGVVGRTVTVNGTPLTVVGVLPAGFSVPTATADVWVPIVMSPEARGRFLRVVGRLRPGVSIESARTEMVTVARRLGEAAPQFNTGWGVNVVPLHEQATGAARPALLVMLGAVGLLLLIACANVASLLLSRAATRRKELAVRASLGASRGRLVSQMMAESLVLASFAGVVGLALGAAGTRLLVRYLPDAATLPRLAEVQVDGRVLAFGVLVSLLTGLLFGAAPAMAASSVRLAEALRDAARGTTSGRGRTRLRSGLVVGEVALAMVLLAGAGLLGRSFWHLQSTDPGFRPERALSVRIPLSGERYAEEGQRREFWSGVHARASAIPGVTAVGTISHLPMTDIGITSTFFNIPGRPAPATPEEQTADIRRVGGEYFRAMGIPLLRGRVFGMVDSERSPNVFVVDQELARRFFPDEDPIGREISYTWGRMVQGRPEPYELRGTIVGVVGSVRQAGPTADAAPAIYRPYAQEPVGQATMVVRTTGDPERVLPALAAAVHSVDPQVPLADARPLEALVGGAVASPRLNLALLGGFAVMALFLAALGIYGVMAYGVAQRRHEMGVRMALGAQGSDVMGLVMRQGAPLALAGVANGVAGSLLLSRALRSLLFGISATDPLTLLAASLFLGGVALAAAFLPAWRATRVDPMVALRSE